MKITKKYLREIIKEELQSALKETPARAGGILGDMSGKSVNPGAVLAAIEADDLDMFQQGPTGAYEISEQCARIGPCVHNIRALLSDFGRVELEGAQKAFCHGQKRNIGPQLCALIAEVAARADY